MLLLYTRFMLAAIYSNNSICATTWPWKIQLMIKSIAIAFYKQDALKKISSKMPKAELGYYTYVLQHILLIQHKFKEIDREEI